MHAKFKIFEHSEWSNNEQTFEHTEWSNNEQTFKHPEWPIMHLI